MQMLVNELVSVVSVFDHQAKKFSPRKLLWNKKEYLISDIALRHPVRTGREMAYIFSVVAGNLFMRLRFDTGNLFWTLEEVDDGQA